MSIKERKESDSVDCPSCGSIENESLMARTNFSLKGKGWYKDGYSSEGSP